MAFSRIFPYASLPKGASPVQPKWCALNEAREGNEMEREDERMSEIRLIAYSLWVRDGYRHGRAVEHWLKAEAIWQADHNQNAPAGVAVEEPGEELEDTELSIYK
jgi:hypothetical protein